MNENSEKDLIGLSSGFMPALQFSGLQFSYNSNRKVLKNINITVEQGEKIGLIGPNGAGKTTLFMLACGVYSPDAGEIELFGNPLTPGQFHPEIGMVFQNSDDQLFSPSVWDDVAFGPQNLGLPTEEINLRVEKALKTTGADGLAKRAPHHLSGGEKRMVSIAGILAMEPKLIIYDEPNASLDTRSRRRLINYLLGTGKTSIISSHDLELVLEVCSRVILLDEGEVVAEGIPDQVMRDGTLMQAHGLEKPHSLTHHEKPHHQI
jgi:cobalt/nickel transport system ATP-binding protein